eukprot:Polyplicarium_translucidae@DN3582_c0_g1_i2.p2
MSNPQSAALRETREETGFASQATVGHPVGVEYYQVRNCGRYSVLGVPLDTLVQKAVFYFAAAVDVGDGPDGEVVRFGRRESSTEHLKWVSAEEVDELPFKSTETREAVQTALQATRPPPLAVLLPARMLMTPDLRGLLGRSGLWNGAMDSRFPAARDSKGGA